MTPADLAEEFDCWKVGLRRCKCGSAVVMAYEPGCTFIRCIAERITVLALPDWQPRALNEEWNKVKINHK